APADAGGRPRALAGALVRSARVAAVCAAARPCGARRARRRPRRGAPPRPRVRHAGLRARAPADGLRPPARSGRRPPGPRAVLSVSRGPRRRRRRVARVPLGRRAACRHARRPIDTSSPAGESTLLSYVWADQLDRIDLLRGALAVARRVPVPVDEANAGSWVAAALERQMAGAASVVFHSIFLQYLDDDER